MPKFISDVQLVGSSTDLILQDGGVIKLGTSNDLQIYHNGTNSHIKNFTGNLYIENAADDQDTIFTNDDGSGGVTEYFRVDGSSVITVFSKPIRLFDNVQIQVGSGTDLRLYHDGSNSYIETSTSSAGDLYIKAQGSGHDLYLQATDDVLIRPQGGNNGIKVIGQGAVELYHNNSKKFDTTSTGIAVTGDADCSGTVYVGGNNSLFSENNLRFKSAGAAYIDHNTVGQSFIFRTSSSSSLDTTALTIASNANATFAGDVIVPEYIKHSGDLDTSIRFTTNKIRFYTANNEVLDLDSSQNATFAGDVTILEDLYATNGNLKFHAGGTHVLNIDLNRKVYPNTHNSTDLGFSSSLAFRHLYMSGNANIGGAISVTGTISNSQFTIPNTAGTAGQVLKWPSSGTTLEWGSGGGGTIDGSGTANDIVMWSDSDTLTDAPIAISGNNATFAGNVEATRYIATNGNMLQLHVDTWNSGNTDHYVLFNGWTSGTGDYVALKSSGNQSGSNGAILIADGNSGGRVYFGLHGNQQSAVDNATDPLATTYAYIGGAGNHFDADTTFSGNVTLSSTNFIELAVDQTDSAKARFGVSSGSTEAFIIADNTGAGHVTGNTSVKLMGYHSSTLEQYGKFHASGLDVRGNVTANFYYDGDNTTYYVNPSGGTTSLNANGELTTDHSVRVTAIDGAGNITPATNHIRLSGYGIIGNRASMYITNSLSSGIIKFGIGGVHNNNVVAQVTSNVNSTGDNGFAISSGYRLGFDQSGTRSWTVKADSGNLNVRSGDGNGLFRAHMPMYATEYDLPSGGMLDWANGDARIVEGLVNNYSLSFQTYDGSNVSTALRLDGDNTATFAGNLTVGSNTVINTSRQGFFASLQHSGVISFLDGSQGTTGSGAQGISVRHVFASGSYNTTPGQGDIWATSDMRSPIFYDYSNTTYYLNPSDSGTSFYMAGGIIGNASQERVKYSVWNSYTYGIGMKNGFDYGHLGSDEYAMTFQMNNSANRGWWWGHESHSDNQGAASLTTDGRMTIASSLSVGQGQSVTSPDTAPLYVSGAADITGDITTTGGDIYGKSVNGDHSKLYRFGGIFFTWDSDSYGTNFNHSITSTYNAVYGDDITINSYGNVRINIDSNGNGNDVFEIGRHTTGNANTMLTLNESSQLTVNGDVRSPIFYDSNDTNYYIDPRTATNGFKFYSSAGAFQLRGQTHWDSKPGIDLTGGTSEFRFSSTGGNLNLRTDGWLIAHDYVRGNLFYDDDDTAYFCDPASGNRFKGITEFKTSAGNARGYLQATDTNDQHFIIATSGGEDIAFKDGGTSGTTNMIVRGDGQVWIRGPLEVPSVGSTNSNVARVALPHGASYSGSGTVTGAFKIKLPVSWTNTMMSMRIVIYDYSDGESFEVQCGGYNHTGSGGYWVNMFGHIIADPNKDRAFNIRFGHDGSNCCIFIGETASTWSYPKVVVTEFIGGHSGYTHTTWDDGWDITAVTSFPSNIDHTESLNQIGRHADKIIDTNNTSYFIDLDGQSRINREHTNYLGLGTGSNSSGSYRLNMGGSIDMNANNIDYVNQLHFNDNVRFYDDGNDSYLNFKYGDTNNGGIKFLNGSAALKGYIYADNSGFGILDNDGNWALRTQLGTSPLELRCNDNIEFEVHTTYTYSPGSSRAPIFYDSNNTGYYVDPNSGSQSGLFKGNLRFDNYGAGVVGKYVSTRYQLVFAMGDAYKGAIDGANVSGGYGLWWSHPNAGGVAANLNSHGLMNIDNGNWQASFSGSTRAAIDMRAPSFYDLNNTGYYLNPNGTSNLYHVNVSQVIASDWLRTTGNSGWYSNTHGGGMYMEDSTYVRVYGTKRLYNAETSHLSFYSAGGMTSTSQMRAPIYYDYNNTAYYTRPSTSSNINSLYTAGLIQAGASGTGNIYIGGTTGNHFRFHTNNSHTYFDGNCGNINWRQGSSTRFIFYMTTANMTVNGTVTQYSDSRLKENIITIDSALNKVNQLRGVYYNRTDINTSERQIGLIAQEVESIVPEVVHTADDDLNTKSISYAQLNALLVEAIKELKADNDSLRARIETLENQ